MVVVVLKAFFDVCVCACACVCVRVRVRVRVLRVSECVCDVSVHECAHVSASVCE